MPDIGIPAVTAAAVRPNDPLPDDWGLVVRGVGTWYILEAYLQRRFDLDNPLIFYVGYAARGTLDAAPAWTIKRINFNASGNPTILQWTSHTASWTLRAIEPYS